MFCIESDPASRLITARFSGFFTTIDVQDYVAALRAEFVRSIGAGLTYVMLLDTTACVLQSQEVIDAFRKHIESFPKARRLAVVNGNSLARMQLKRILVRDYLRFFETEQDARRWLLEPQSAQTAVALESA